MANSRATGINEAKKHTQRNILIDVEMIFVEEVLVKVQELELSLKQIK